jgi:hypothetical protein
MPKFHGSLPQLGPTACARSRSSGLASTLSPLRALATHEVFSCVALSRHCGIGLLGNSVKRAKLDNRGN